MPFTSVWSAVTARAALSPAVVTSKVVVQATPAQAEIEVTPPTLTVTVLVFSLHAPLMVYAALLALLMTGDEVIVTVGSAVSFTTVVAA